jgi:hypothetical protein
VSLDLWAIAGPANEAAIAPAPADAVWDMSYLFIDRTFHG